MLERSDNDDVKDAPGVILMFITLDDCVLHPEHGLKCESGVVCGEIEIVSRVIGVFGT